MAFKGILPNKYWGGVETHACQNPHIYILLPHSQSFHESIYIAGMDSHLMAVEYSLYVEEEYIEGCCVACSIQ